ncbi:MAG TPA: lipopolysaccharide transport periplasmic protein LptA [Burkholderiaceae bacterium]|nr:lipopolysaccharide transport periplasmic protein LptA [Burkholderiaceae bacterium]
MKGVLLCLLLGASTVAGAETADRDQPIQVEAQKGNYNDLKQVGVFSGDVIVTKGTIRVTGDRLELRKDPEGYEYAVMTAANGQLARFRQRRDASRPGAEEFIEGQAERIEYDGRAETVRLITRAQLSRLENDQKRDELRGNLITYDSRTTEYSVDGASAASPDGRVRAIIAPRNSTPSQGQSAPLKSAPTVGPSG